MKLTDVKSGSALSCSQPTGSIERKPYLSPQLVEYGRVLKLTRGGSPDVTSDSGNNNMRAPSDKRLKESVARIGTHPLGFGLYLFDYKAEFRDACGQGRQFGVMADEVEMVMPEAVSIGANGYMQVDYGMLGIGRAAN